MVRPNLGMTTSTATVVPLVESRVPSPKSRVPSLESEGRTAMRPYTVLSLTTDNRQLTTDYSTNSFTAATILASLGTTNCSIGGLNGTGTSGAVRRLTGPSR